MILLGAAAACVAHVPIDAQVGEMTQMHQAGAMARTDGGAASDDVSRRKQFAAAIERASKARHFYESNPADPGANRARLEEVRALVDASPREVYVREHLHVLANRALTESHVDEAVVRSFLPQLVLP
jgi:hypothetical protein